MLEEKYSCQIFAKNGISIGDKKKNLKGAGASEAPSQTKEEFSINDTSRHPKLLKIGPQYG